MFLKNAKASVVGNTEKDGDDNRLYDRYCAEARLLRAIFHFDLICWFGAAPVIAEDESGEPIIFDLSVLRNESCSVLPLPKHLNG